MFYRIINPSFVSLFVYTLFFNPLSAVYHPVEVTVPKTAYVQWLSSPGGIMSQAFDNQTYVNFSQGQAEQELYLGIMCNSLAGYQVSIVTDRAIGGSTGEAIGSNGQRLKYTVSVHPVSGSLRGAAVSLGMVDLRGGAPAISATFSSESALPLKAHLPNVYLIRAAATDPSAVGETYSATINVMITMP